MGPDAEASIWRRFAAGGLDGLAQRAARIDPGDVSAVARLRRDHPADEVRVALQLAEGRRRLAGKVEDPSRWLADSDGAQMATDRLIAAHKARRFARSDREVIDLCSGIGADARELARVAPVRCVEIDPSRAIMCGHNTGREVIERDASAEDVAGLLVHMDPARRDSAGRLARLADLVPGPEVIGRVVRESAGAGVKLMPGVDRADLQGLATGVAGELEHISLRGRMSQAVWWTGELAGTTARATMIDEGVSETLSGEPTPAGGDGSIDAWLYAVNPAAERAGLLPALAESLGVREVFAGVGVLTSPDRRPSPWLTGFRVLERMPWRAERVREAVAGLGGGLVEVKTRGGAANPDRAQLALRGEGDRTLTVFVLRFGSRVQAIVAERA